MRYSVIAKGIPVEEVLGHCLRIQAKNIKSMQATKQVFCDMEPEQAARLSKVQGLAVKKVEKVSGDSLAVAPLPAPAVIPMFSTGLNLRCLDIKRG